MTAAEIKAEEAAHAEALRQHAPARLARFATLTVQEAADTLYREWFDRGSDFADQWETRHIREADTITTDSPEAAQKGAAVIYSVAYRFVWTERTKAGVQNMVDTSRLGHAAKVAEEYLTRLDEIEARLGVRLDVERPGARDIVTLRQMDGFGVTWGYPGVEVGVFKVKAEAPKLGFFDRLREVVANA